MSALRKPKHPANSAPPPIPVKTAWTQDLIWGKPVFKAPNLPNPRAIFDPIPFTATRVTYRPDTAGAKA
ncbi:MAG: hypothetical protein H7A44_13430 [Opitutaceae bacterium]|jgi:hypothetical protein|nr:hypothetical protein [Cephaloticoccus sp.]MCP5531427.1 hypothetical protein [Opitutaceae bacterium]